MGQLTYDRQPIGYEGDLADTSTSIIDSAACEGDLPFAKAVTVGSVAGTCKLASDTGDVIIGVSKRDLTAINADDGSGAKYKDKDSVSIINFGRVLAAPIVDVSENDAVWFVHLTGKFSNVVGAADTLATLIPNWKWKSTVVADALAILEVR